MANFFSTRGISPYRPKQLFRLFFLPHKFFSANVATTNFFYVAIAICICGITFVTNDISNYLYNEWADLDAIQAPLDYAETTVQDWRAFWTEALSLCVWKGLLSWIFGGWWFRYRIKASGDTHPDPRLSRVVFVYTYLIFTLPRLAHLLIWTALYKSYAEAYAQALSWSYIALLYAVALWSNFCACACVSTVFSVSSTRAKLWFIVLPCLWYAFCFQFFDPSLSKLL